MQVILVGHDFGGACISYAMELFHFKIAKAVFIAAAMLSDGQNTLDVFSLQVLSFPDIHDFVALDFIICGNLNFI